MLRFHLVSYRQSADEKQEQSDSEDELFQTTKLACIWRRLLTNVSTSPSVLSVKEDDSEDLLFAEFFQKEASESFRNAVRTPDYEDFFINYLFKTEAPGSRPVDSQADVCTKAELQSHVFVNSVEDLREFSKILDKSSKDLENKYINMRNNSLNNDESICSAKDEYLNLISYAEECLRGLKGSLLNAFSFATTVSNDVGETTAHPNEPDDDGTQAHSNECRSEQCNEEMDTTPSTPNILTINGNIDVDHVV